jgi:cytochrome P450
VESRRRQPGADLISELLAARVDGEALTQKELMGFCYLLLLAGLESTSYMLGFCVKMLSERPELMARLKADTSLIPRFIEEMLRYEAPVQATNRITTQETQLGGVRIPPGSMVLLMQGSALRDESQFPNGHVFDIDRAGHNNMAFGHGVHYCLGAMLARMEGRIALESLLNKCGKLGRVSGFELCHGLTMRGPTVLTLPMSR